MKSKSKPYVVAGPVVDPHFLNGATEKNCDVLFWGESPGEEEAKKGQAFVGPSGRLMQTLIEAELPKVKVRLDNVCPEWLNGKKPRIPQHTHYRDRNHKIVDICKPKVMVLLGEHPMRFFKLPPPIKPSRRCGEKVEVLDIPTVISVHPAYILRTPRDVSKLRMVFAVIKGLLKKPAKDQVRIVTGDEFRKLLKQCEHEEVAFDIETTSVDPRSCQLLTASFTPVGRDTFVAPFFHPESPGPALKNLKYLTEWWPKGPRIVHNAKFECHFMIRLTQEMPDLTDTLLKAFLEDENKPKGLDDLAVRHCGATPWWTDIKGDFSKIPLDRLAAYNAKDTEWTEQIDEVITGKLTPAMIEVHDRILAPVTKVLVRMEHRGLKVNETLLKSGAEEIKRMIKQRERKTEKEFPGLNPRSPKQMQELLFDKLGLKPIRFSKKTRNPSADEETIIHYAKDVPELKTLGETRQLASLKSRIYDAWEGCIDEGYIRSSLDIGIAVNLRIASSNPNLQNMERIPDEETEEASWLRKLSPRKLIVSRHRGGKLLQLDYSANQLRLMAVIANVRPMIEAFEKGVDVHEMTRVKLEPILKKHVERRRAKNANFTLLFEGTEYALHTKYGIPKKEGRELKEAWYKAYPEIPAYHHWTEQFIRQNNYIENCFGTRRRLPIMTGSGRDVDRHNRSMFRQGCNYPISSPEALLMYMAMIEIEEELPPGLGEQVLQVHDSIVIDCPSTTAAKKAGKICTEIMESQGTKCLAFTKGRLDRPIPLKVDIKIGDTL